ncbi:uncharacterized protein LOC112679903 isoform X2 [Sipha flava]|uniref:Uncharacterized protein LOC112679903 isoform X2 n=1 Tax=Sipha flava TaxID=143950 RepID=A0A8B8F4Z0_9HEMI|nr:uncharacterized protein LOC112679903 isoform X2 [Sipha flava]
MTTLIARSPTSRTLCTVTSSFIARVDDSEEHDSLTGSISEEENSKTMKTSEEVDFEKEFRPDDVELCHAATKIQASFRGHMTRKQQAGGKDEPGGATGSATLSKTEGLESQLKNVDINKDLDAELLDVDLADPELHKAATKIQASFRGHKARKADDAVDNKE